MMTRKTNYEDDRITPDLGKEIPQTLENEMIILTTQDIQIKTLTTPLPSLPNMKLGTYVMVSCDITCECECPPYSGKTIIKCDTKQHAQNVYAIITKYIRDKSVPKTQNAVVEMINRLKPIL